MTKRVPPCEVLVDQEPRSGTENMRLDEELLQRVVDDDSTAFVRIYRWNCPTVTLGYFQQLTEEIDPQISACPRVKRVTGGGAILHDQELTYSCALPASHPMRHEPVRLYEEIHSAVIDLLAEQGINASMRQRVNGWQEPETPKEPFLCFLRSDARDVVIDGRKILGSAQRRRRGSILQHGSILLSASALTPNVVGIQDLRPEFDAEEFGRQLPAAIGARVSGKFRISTSAE